MPGNLKFNKPPLIEAIIGVQLSEPLIDSGVVFKLGNEFIVDFPNIEERPAILSVNEDLEKAAVIGAFPSKSSRKLFKSIDDQKLIQLQDNKFLFNIRMLKPEHKYPGFEILFENFSSLYKTIEKNISIINKVNQYEITYINHIFPKDYELTSNDISEIINFYNLPHNFKLKSFDSQLSFAISEINSVLSIKMQNAKMIEDNRLVIVIELTCRGYSNEMDWRSWAIKAHDVIRTYFEYLFTPKARKIWQ